MSLKTQVHDRFCISGGIYKLQAIDYDKVKRAIIDDKEDFDLVIAAINKLDSLDRIKLNNILETYKSCKRNRFGDFEE